MKWFGSFVVVLWTMVPRGVTGFARSAPKIALSPINTASSSSPLVPQADASFARLEPLVQHGATNFPESFHTHATLSDYAKAAGKKYMSLSEEKPFVTKGLSAATVGGIGDVFSQFLFAYATGTPFRWDMMRTITFLMMGLCFKGPALHIWYNMLGRVSHWAKVRKGFSETSQSLAALTLDQTVGVAIFYPLYFIVFELFSSTLSFRRKWVPCLVACTGLVCLTIVLTPFLL